MGRPTKFSQAIADKICALLAEGYSLTKISALDGMPALRTVLDWHVQNREGFSAQYTRARQIQAELIADQLFDVSDDETKDVSGELEIPNGVAVQRARLKVDTRKWYLSKMLPKVYGDKLAHTGADGEGPVQFVVTRAGQKEKA
jgi:hypothetical protein